MLITLAVPVTILCCLAGYSLQSTQRLTRESLLTLTSLNIDHYLTEHRYIFAQFYWPDCRQCDIFLPHLQRVQDEVNKSIFNITLAQIDASEDQKLVKKYFPAALNKESSPQPYYVYFANKRGVVYRGKNNAKDMAYWLKKRMIKPSKTFGNQQQLEDIRNNEHRVLTYVGLRNKFYHRFRYVVGTFEGINLYHSFAAPARHVWNRTVTYWQERDKTAFDLKVPYTEEELTRFIIGHHNVQNTLDVIS